MKNRGPWWTYKAFGSVVHQAQLEPLLVFEGFCQSVTEAVGGKHALSALLKLAEYTLKNSINNRIQPFHFFYICI